MNGPGRGPDRGGARRPPGRPGAPPRGAPAPEPDRGSGRRALRTSVADALLAPGVIENVSPGFYFQRCLEVWGARFHEVVKEKAKAVRLLQRIRGDVDLHRALVQRQAEVFQGLRATSPGATVFRLRNITPFLTGIGQPHPLETGFAFLKPYGVPYLAASGVKGAVRAACADDWMERFGEAGQRERLRHYFGSADKAAGSGRRDADDHTRGALMFLDLLPELPAGGRDGWASAVRLDIVNPHYGKYYQGASAPADWLAPVPSYFLTLRAGLEWRLYVIYAPRGGTARADWEKDIEPGVRAALMANGLGAKKSWGYGLFDLLPETPSRKPEASSGVPSSRVAPSPPASASPPVSAAVASTRSLIAALPANQVKGRISQIENAIRACPPDDRPVLLTELEGRLGALGLARRDIREVVDRLRRALGMGSP